MPATPGVDPTVWAAIGGGRRAIQLLRPFTTPANAFGAIQLWDSSVGYELSSNDADPTHTTLRWANGAASGFARRSLTAESAVMQATITVP